MSCIQDFPANACTCNRSWFRQQRVCAQVPPEYQRTWHDRLDSVSHRVQCTEGQHPWFLQDHEHEDIVLSAVAVKDHLHILTRVSDRCQMSNKILLRTSDEPPVRRSVLGVPKYSIRYHSETSVDIDYGNYFSVQIEGSLGHNNLHHCRCVFQWEMRRKSACLCLGVTGNVKRETSPEFPCTNRERYIISLVRKLIQRPSANVKVGNGT